MNFKKILALTIVVLAVFCCLNVASAGIFDFLGGGEETVANETFSFSGFTLDFPNGTAVINDSYTTPSGIEVNSYIVSTGEATYTVEVSHGSEMVTSSQEYAHNMVDNHGASVGNSYGNWTVINFTSVENSTYSDYILANYIDGTLFEIQGDDLDQMKSIIDTFKKE